MKIRVAILEKDICYLNRMQGTFGMKYADKLELYSFSEKEAFMDSLKTNKTDVLLAGEEFGIDPDELPDRCGMAYLVESGDIESVRDQKAICKFQKAENIYKQILNIYSERAANLSGVRGTEGSCGIVVFTSPAGGTGASSLAAAYSMRKAGQGQRVIYLDLEAFSSTGHFFPVNGQFDMSDIIYAIKGRKSNVALKIESCVRQDGSGVFFFAPPKTALDMREMNEEDALFLLSSLTLSGNYDRIVVDMDFGLEKHTLDILERSDGIVMTSDGTEISNGKLAEACHAIETMEQSSEHMLSDKLAIIYNRFSNKSGKVLEGLDIKMLGGIPKYENAATKQILGQIRNMEFLDRIVQ